MRRLVGGLLAGMVIAVSSQGCDIHVSSNADDSGDCSPVSYDLTGPPSRAELGMDSGQGFLSKSCDDGFEVTLRLPEGTTTSLTATRVNADSYSADDPGSDPPTTVDVHSVSLSVDEAVRLASRLADGLGSDATPLPRWQEQAETRSADSIDSPFLRNRLGYLTVEMQVQHLGVSGNNYLHLVLSWG